MKADKVDFAMLLYFKFRCTQVCKTNICKIVHPNSPRGLMYHLPVSVSRAHKYAWAMMKIQEHVPTMPPSSQPYSPWWPSVWYDPGIHPACEWDHSLSEGHSSERRDHPCNWVSREKQESPSPHLCTLISSTAHVLEACVHFPLCGLVRCRFVIIFVPAFQSRRTICLWRVSHCVTITLWGDEIWFVFQCSSLNYLSPNWHFIVLNNWQCTCSATMHARTSIPNIAPSSMTVMWCGLVNLG